MQIQSRSLEEFNAEARRFARTLEPGNAARIVALSGDLGVGKTTYVQTLAREFGVEDQVNSPTFVIEKIYECSEGPFVHLIHIDAYRLKNAHELEVLGWADIAADKANLILMEWPEHVEDLLPPGTTRISFTGADDERTIVYGEK